MKKIVLILFLLISQISISQKTVIEIDSLMRIKTITFPDKSKRVYVYKQNGIYLMQLYNKNGTLSSTVIDRMDIEEIKEEDSIKPLGHIYRLP
jgi:hypothetical protein